MYAVQVNITYVGLVISHAYTYLPWSIEWYGLLKSVTNSVGLSRKNYDPRFWLRLSAPEYVMDIDSLQALCKEIQTTKVER